VIVVGNPHWINGASDSRAAGAAVAVARAASTSGAEVQLVGKIGEDAAGDAVLLDLAKAGIAHVAVLRDPGIVTPTAQAAPDETTVDGADPGAPPQPESPGARLDAGDIALALRYLTDYRVIVVAQPLDDAAMAAAVSAGTWSNAALVVLVPAGRQPPADLPDTATVFETPPDDADETFAGMVGRYAAALDRGEDPATAFAAVTSDSGWSPASADNA
jgi:hypothetical protein